MDGWMNGWTNDSVESDRRPVSHRAVVPTVGKRRRNQSCVPTRVPTFRVALRLGEVIRRVELQSTCNIYSARFDSVCFVSLQMYYTRDSYRSLCEMLRNVIFIVFLTESTVNLVFNFIAEIKRHAYFPYAIWYTSTVLGIFFSRTIRCQILGVAGRCRCNAWCELTETNNGQLGERPCNEKLDNHIANQSHIEYKITLISNRSFCTFTHSLGRDVFN